MPLAIVSSARRDKNVAIPRIRFQDSSLCF
jgi:hypothetical protein